MNPFVRTALFAALTCSAPAFADDKASPVADPVLDKPTLRSLGAYWIIKGDANANASVRVDYRKTGKGDWKQGPSLFRVEHGKHKPKENDSLLKIEDGDTLFAGSVLMLDPDTAYDLKLTLTDPDGGQATKTLSAHTIAEPVAPTGGRTLYVIPGDGGGRGTKDDPYKGIASCEGDAMPGDTFLLAPGTYSGAVRLRRSGDPGKPIIWRGSDDAAGGKTIIDGQANARAVTASGLHDVWFEDLSVRNATYGIVSQESGRMVIRRCHFNDVDFGIAATKNGNDSVNDYFVTDNVMVGRSKWPRSEGIEDRRGVQLTGSGHVIAYNRISHFGDAIDTMPSIRCDSIDIHNNDCDILTDDGIETDYSQRNVRVFENRLTNIFQGISTQPVYGGPIYIFRNALFNVCVEPFKMHNSPSGALFLHNTIVKAGPAHVVMTTAPMSNMVSRNNLFVGTTAKTAVDMQVPATDCDFDYDGFAIKGSPNTYLNWNRGAEKFGTFEQMRQKAPVWKNAIQVNGDTVFASGVHAPQTDKEAIGVEATDTRLASSSAAIDAGQKLPGVNDDFKGMGPDLGAYELGAPLPHYGPRTKQDK